MFDMENCFPEKYKKAAALTGPTTFTIQDVIMEDVAQGERKPVVRFVGDPQGFVLNKTNTDTIVAAYGRDADSWAGRQLTLFATTVPFQGRMVPAIRVAVPSAGQPVASQQPVPAPQPTPAPPAAPVAQSQPAAAPVHDSNSW